MQSVSYGKEPFDLKLLLLRTLKNSGKLLALCALLTLVCGGAYLIKNVVLRTEKTYQATSLYKMDFANEAWGQFGTYINETTWNTWVKTDEFVGNVMKHLKEQGETALTEEDLRTMLTARLDSDVRMPCTVVTGTVPDQVLAVARAVEANMTKEFLQGVSADITAIRLVDAGKVEEVIPDVRPVRAYVLSLVLSLLFVYTLYFLWELSGDGLWLPACLRTRYGLAVLGTCESTECLANLKYRFREVQNIVVCPVSEDIDPMQVVKVLRDLELSEEMTVEEEAIHSFTAVPSPILSPQVCEKLREAEGVLLVVKAGRKSAGRLAHMLSLFQEQDVKVTAALLWEADEKLLNHYYCLDRMMNKRKTK